MELKAESIKIICFYSVNKILFVNHYKICENDFIRYCMKLRNYQLDEDGNLHEVNNANIKK